MHDAHGLRVSEYRRGWLQDLALGFFSFFFFWRDGVVNGGWDVLGFFMIGGGGFYGMCWVFGRWVVSCVCLFVSGFGI